MACDLAQVSSAPSHGQRSDSEKCLSLRQGSWRYFEQTLRHKNNASKSLVREGVFQAPAGAFSSLRDARCAEARAITVLARLALLRQVLLRRRNCARGAGPGDLFAPLTKTVFEIGPSRADSDSIGFNIHFVRAGGNDARVHLSPFTWGKLTAD